MSSTCHLHHVQMTSKCHPHIIRTCLSCPISCSTTPGVMHMSSTGMHPNVVHCHLHHVWMTSKCHLHIIRTCLSCPISCSTTPGVMHISSTGIHVIRTLSAGMHVIRSCHPHLPEVPNFICISGTTSGTTVTSKTTSFGTIGIHGDSWE